MNSLFTKKDIIDIYTQEQAIEDGVLIKVGSFANGKPIIITTNLFHEVKDKIKEIIDKSIQMLKQKNSEDDEYMKLRVIEKNKIWAILNTEGLTIMKPEDY
jgi:hypothetical protein